MVKLIYLLTVLFVFSFTLIFSILEIILKH